MQFGMSSWWRTVVLSQRDFLILLLLLAAIVWQGEATAAELHLTWVDNSGNEYGFKIERRAGLVGTFVQIAAVGANVTSYTDSELATGTFFCYRTRAFNAAGDSAYSNEACGTTTTVMAAFESPASGQSVSGITVIQGWAFDTQAGYIDRVELFIDGVYSGDIPCCSERGDVQAAFPEFPANNTLNSGWGTIFNWGLLNPGTHTVQVEIMSTDGELLATQPRTVTVVKPGDFEFLDRFELSGAVADVEGDALVVEGVVVRDKTTFQEKEIDARFRWLPTAQSVGMVEAVTVAELASLRARVFSLFTQFGAWLGSTSAVARAQAALGIAAAFESPDAGRAVFGVGIIGGWAFAEDPAAAVTETRLVIDGLLGSTIPYGSERGDVAAAFPGHPNALNSGWGITFNYGLLSPGFHTVGAQLASSTGASLLLEHGVVVVKPDGVEFLDQFDLSGATARIAGEDIIIEGVWVRDKSSQQTTLVDVGLRWFLSSQALGIVSFAE